MNARCGKVRLKFRARINRSKAEVAGLPQDTEVSFVPMEAVGTDGTIRLDMTRTLGELSQGYTYFRNGDVLVAKITPCFENGKGAVARGLKNGIGFGTTELHVLHPTALEPRYLFYVTLSHDFRAMGSSQMYGSAGQKRVPESFLSDFSVADSPIDQQARIADFLDEKTAAIHALIAKKERLVDLLAEKRQALVTQAVTQGLKPHVTMKPTRVEVARQVPAHWVVLKAKHIIIALTSGSRGWAAYYSDSGALFLQSGNVTSEMTLDPSRNQCVSPPSGSEGVRTVVLRDDVLVVITGVHTGYVAHVREPLPLAYVNQHLALLRVDRHRAASRFVAYWLASRVGAVHFEMLRYGGTKEGLGLDDVGDVPLALPPRTEQLEIVAYLDGMCDRLAAATRLVESQIVALHEYRQAVIYAAVTGQIDVRAEQAGVHV